MSRSPPSCAPRAPRTISSSAAPPCATAAFGLLRPPRREGRGQPASLASTRASSPRRELAAIWHLPSIEYATVPFARSALPVAPAPPAIFRPADGVGTLTRRARPGLDPRRAAQAEHRRARHRRAGQVELPRRDRRRGSAQGALRRDRARSEGRRRRGRRQPRARRSDAARCSTSRIRPAASTRSPSTRPPT